MKSFCIFILIFLFSSNHPVRGQIFRHESESYALKKNPSRFKDSFARTPSIPGIKSNRELWYLAGYITITTSILYSLDTPVYNQFSRSETETSGSVLNTLTAPGRLYDWTGPDIFVWGTSGILLSGGYLSKDSKFVNTGWTVLKAVFFTQLTTNALKFGFGRSRPFIQEGANRFSPFRINGEHAIHSMPSGHTSRIFALTAVLTSSYDTPWVRIPAYTLAGSVALQRLESHKHWLSDVVVGGTLGYLIGRSFAKHSNLIEHKSSITVDPLIKEGFLGFNIHF